LFLLSLEATRRDVTDEQFDVYLNIWIHFDFHARTSLSGIRFARLFAGLPQLRLRCQKRKWLELGRFRRPHATCDLLLDCESKRIVLRRTGVCRLVCWATESRHLRVLTRAGLVFSRRTRQYTYILPIKPGSPTISATCAKSASRLRAPSAPLCVIPISNRVLLCRRCRCTHGLSAESLHGENAKHNESHQNDQLGRQEWRLRLRRS